ncbi:50S ribosomal protein L3 [candidate division KSB1 bacterium]
MEKLLGKKMYMTSFYDEQRRQLPVTVLQVGPCYITQLRTKDKDGYDAVQIGYWETKKQRVNKPRNGHFKKAGVKPLKKLVEFRTGKIGEYELGGELTVDRFNVGELISVTARSKGRGFTGVVKKYNFKGGPKTHGQSDRFRARGSIGASSDPSRVVKGMRMAGQTGNKRTTVINLTVVDIDKEKNLLIVKGAVPGHRNSIVEVVKR